MERGKHTTEFWLTILTQIMVIAMALLGKVEAEWAVVATSICSGIYAGARNYRKGKAGDEEMRTRILNLLADNRLRDVPTSSGNNGGRA